MVEDRSARVSRLRAILVVAALVALGREAIGADPTDASYGQTQVTGLYQLLARINGEPLSTSGADPYPRSGMPYADSKPVICFPRGVGRFTRSAWKATPSLFASAEKALDALAFELKRARAASKFGNSAPTIKLRLIGFADPTTEPAKPDKSRADDNKFDLSLDRAVAVRDALRKRLPTSGFAFEAEGRGHYFPRPTDPHPQDAADASEVENTLEVVNDSDDSSCAPFEAAPKGGVKAARTTLALADSGKPESKRYVAAQRRVEIEVVTPVMTHVGHSLTRKAESSQDKSDARLRLYPNGTMPARVFTHELVFVPLAPPLGEPPKACTPSAGGGSLKLWRPVSSGWLRQMGPGQKPDEKVELPTSKLDGGDTLALRLDIDEVWKREGAKTRKGWRVSVLVANRAGYDPKAEPESYDRGLGVPGYWAVHQRFVHLMKIALKEDGAVAKCIGVLAAHEGSKLKELPTGLETMRDDVLARVPKDLDGILLHVHRLDRRFRFFDLAAGMVLRPSPTDHDTLRAWMRPGDPTPIVLKPDPIDPCSPVPLPRKWAGLSDPRRVLTGDPFVGLFEDGYEFSETDKTVRRLCGRLVPTSENPTVGPTNTCTGIITSSGSSDYPESSDRTGCTRQIVPVNDTTALEAFLVKGPVRIYGPGSLVARRTYVSPPRDPRDDECRTQGDQICHLNKGLFSEDLGGFASLTLMATASDLGLLDSWRGAREFNPAKWNSGDPDYMTPLTPCVDGILCGAIAPGMALSPAIAVETAGQAAIVSLGSRIAHLVPESLSSPCFVGGGARGRWPRQAALGSPIDIDLAGPAQRSLVAPRNMLMDRRDCRLLGLILTHGSRITWSR